MQYMRRPLLLTRLVLSSSAEEREGCGLSPQELCQVGCAVQKAQLRVWVASKKSADTTLKLLQLEGKQGQS